ncbi:MAG: guanylate kinase [bacterium]
MPKQQKIIILSSTAGGGKNTIANMLLQKDKRLKETISCTTRKPIRPGEKDCVNYYFINTDEFEKKIKNKKFIEWEKVHGLFYYGTLKDEIPKIIKKNKIPLLIIDVKGAMNIKKIFPKTLLIFIKPNSMKNIEERIRLRAKISEEEIKTRLKTAKNELKMAKYYDRIIKNPEGHPEKAAKKALKIIGKYYLQK